MRQKAKEAGKPKRYYKPDEEQSRAYNDFVAIRIREEGLGGGGPGLHGNPLEKLGGILKEAAAATLEEIPRELKKDDISKDTWGMMVERGKAQHRGETDKAEELKKKIKIEVRKDKLREKLAQLEEADEKGYKWEGLKRIRCTFTPKFCKFNDLREFA